MTSRGRPGTENRLQAATSSSSSSLFSAIAYPFTACISGTRGTSQDDDIERRGLLGREAGGSDASAYDDSDAISLLSNIQDRSRRRNRRRTRRIVADLGCGLFGRTRGQIEAQGSGSARHQNLSSGSSSRDEGLGLLHAFDEDQDDPHTLQPSDSGRSLESSGAASLGAVQESGDEDAGMLDDADIAELSHSRDDDQTVTQDDQHHGTTQDESHEIAKRKKRLELDAELYAREEAELAAQQRREEEHLAAEEEAKARVRQGGRQQRKDAILKEANRPRRLTEADAEAAAGGFDFGGIPSGGVNNDSAYYEGHDFGGDSDEEHTVQYHDAASPQQGVVVHHHYYHDAEQPEQGYFGQDAHQYRPEVHVTNDDDADIDVGNDASQLEEDEDAADIAGLSFSKNRAKRGGTSGTDNGSDSRHSDNSGQRSSDLRRSSLSPSHSMHLEPTSPVRIYDRDRAESGNSSASGSGTGASRRREQPRRRQSTNTEQEEAPAHDARADAAAGGFDGFSPPPPSTSPTSPRSSAASNERNARRREQPRTKRPSNELNAPRNLHGSNPFT